MRPLHNSILANFIRFFTMKSMVNSQIFARMRVMQRSRYVFLTNIARYSVIHSSMIVVGSLVGVASATTYAIALNIVDRLEGIVRMALFMTMPAFTGIASTETDGALLRTRFLMVARIAALGVSLVCGGLMVAGEPFINA
jgi:hypothetical protein